jgi:bacillithiol system protein YtxJ
VGPGFEQRAQCLRTPEEAEAFLASHPDGVVFKAGGCHRTQDALDAVRPILDPRSDIPVALIRVIEARSASRRVAELTGVRHESPQVILLRAGRAVLAQDNWRVSAPELERAILEHFGPPPGGPAAA